MVSSREKGAQLRNSIKPWSPRGCPNAQRVPNSTHQLGAQLRHSKKPWSPRGCPTAQRVPNSTHQLCNPKNRKPNWRVPKCFIVNGLLRSRPASFLLWFLKEKPFLERWNVTTRKPPQMNLVQENKSKVVAWFLVKSLFQKTTPKIRKQTEGTQLPMQTQK